MKLIDLLVQELPSRGGWPKTEGDVTMIAGLFQSAWRLPSHVGIVNYIAYSLNDNEIVTREQYEEALSASQQPVWSGEGMPPVGITCEHCPGGTTQHDWEIVTVIGISDRPGGCFTDYWLRKEDGSSYVIGNPYRFRPIQTEAERKREEATDEIASLIGRGTYSQDAESIYDAIAAGKIPGVKLE